MILHQFPNLQWLKAQAASQFADRQGVGGIKLMKPGWPTVVLNTRASAVVRDNIQGPLSIFTNLSGSSEVKVDKKRVSVSSDNFFISNAGQNYSLELSGKSTTETFNIHFGEDFSQNAIPNILTSKKDILENPELKEGFGFYNRIIPIDETFKKIVNAIRECGNDTLLLEVQLFELLKLILLKEKNVKEARERFPSIKSSTKTEILRRLLTSTDYLYTYYDKNPGLDELAAISCFSKFHFLRLFKIAYEQTPHQFIIALKIKKAAELLQRTNDDVRAIADAVGFENSSSFSRTFYKEMGYYPSHYREMVKG
ncbi:MAG TPA: AraC family transcriptional regulator [Cyclobacteriaceae bacterium]|nr:AraC family transcriptional regulator [Cyclobacteriaceae bacterium]